MGILRAMPTSPSLALLRAAHPRQVLGTAIAVATAAAVAGRPLREVLLVGATVLVGQSVLGWSDDIADRDRDARHRPEKPLGNGSLDTGTAWFAIACAVSPSVRELGGGRPVNAPAPMALLSFCLAVIALALVVRSAIGDRRVARKEVTAPSAVGSKRD